MPTSCTVILITRNELQQKYPHYTGKQVLRKEREDMIREYLQESGFAVSDQRIYLTREQKTRSLLVRTVAA